MLRSASYWWTATTVRPMVLGATEQVVNSICTFRRMETSLLKAISLEKQFTAKELNTLNMIKYLQCIVDFESCPSSEKHRGCMLVI